MNEETNLYYISELRWMALAGITQGYGKIGAIGYRRFQEFEFVSRQCIGLRCSTVQYDVPAKHDQ